MPALDDSLEAKALKLFEYVDPDFEEDADVFLNSLGRTTNESSRTFIYSIGVLLSSANQTITNAAMMTLARLYLNCSAEVRLPLVKADLIHQLVNTLNPLTLSFTEGVDLHLHLMEIVNYSVSLATSLYLEVLEIEDVNEQQAVHETVLKQVLAPSEKYLQHLCVNRYSIVDGDQRNEIMALLATIIRISPYYQLTMDFVLHMPVFLTIPSCLTFFEYDESIWYFLYEMNNTQRDWNKKGEKCNRWRRKFIEC
ncbi:hypothetical protein BLNAU_7415 [Blattamonas nauphoetae]|uniref:Uncharacterized protein n=1 Tax=Blattamonas nauphoetae TaxID=2049346 RepID=A0ABQ9Y196_9EUKA|nr:hypothetical protein BLNAU_7415 [Blattamonas nauphoetae]